MHETLQLRLMDAIVAKFEKRAGAVEAISQLLDMGKDSVYRRLRGDTLLLPDEMGILAKHFRISLDSLLFERTDTVFFTYNQFTDGARDFQEFLMSYAEEMERANQYADYSFYYASAELPLFQSLFVPELISFKLFIWGRTVLDFEFIKGNSFSFDLIPYPIIQLSERMAQLYKDLASTELWSQNIVDNTLNQIEYHLGVGGFANGEDALVLCDKLVELTHHMQQMAEHGYKSMPGVRASKDTGAPFALYHNEMVHTNNTILANTVEGKVLFTTLSNPNFLRSTDQKLCEYMDNWFERVVKKSNSISQHAEKNREWFFNRIRRKIEQSRNRMATELGVQF